MPEQPEEAKIRYGKKKLSPEAYAAQTAAKSLEGREATKYGKRKGQRAAPASTQVAGAPAAPSTRDAVTDPAIGRIRETIAKRPAMLPAVLGIEIKREGGPRALVLDLLETAEKARVEGRRDKVLERIAAARELVQPDTPAAGTPGGTV